MNYFLVKTHFKTDDQIALESFCIYDDKEQFEHERDFLKDYFSRQTELFLPITKEEEVVFFTFDEFWENVEVKEISKEQMSIIVDVLGTDELGPLNMMSIVEAAVSQDFYEATVKANSFLDKEIQKLIDDVNNKMN